MSETFTQNIGLRKMVTGERVGTWGEFTNTTFDILDRVTSGVGTVTLSGDSSTITTTDAALSDGHYAVLVLAGAPSGTHTLTFAPNDQSRIFFVNNTTNYTVILKQGTGAGSTVNIPSGRGAIVYADGGGAGANVVSLTTPTSLGLGTMADENAADYAALSGATFTGAVNESYAAVTSSANTTTVNCSTANNFSTVLTENTTFSFTNVPSAGTAYGFTLEIIQNAGGSGYTVAWPASVVWSFGVEPTLSTAANAIDIFVFRTRDGGSTWHGFVSGQGMA